MKPHAEHNAVPAPVDLFELREQLQGLAQILTQEYQLLGSDAFSELDPLLQKKQTLLNNIAAFTDEMLLERLQSSSGEQAGWDDFVAELTRCQQQNLVNGATMLEMLKMREQGLRVLLGRPTRPQQLTYHANGRVHPDDSHRALGKA